jgi:molybdate transport system ATP-binding protein
MTALSIKLHQSGPIPLAVDFNCDEGELLVLTGPSGGGKTTILRSIAGLYHPEQGNIECAGSCWLDSSKQYFLPPQKRSAGLVFQHYSLFPHLSAGDNVKIALGHLPAEKRQDRVHRLFDLVNLEGLENRYTYELSGGQQQRVALARALAREPAILLLDEPFSAVDQVTRRKLRQELARLRMKLNIPIIFVTHDLDEARMLADRMCIVHNGKSLQTDAPELVMSKPENAEVAYLVDILNVFSGKIIRHDVANKITYLKWNEHELECALREKFAPGTKVDWVIPPESIILHRRDRPSRGERENPVSGIIDQSIPMGENTSIIMKLNGTTEVLSFNIPTHTARRNHLDEGEEINVSLLAEAIHIMPKAASLSGNQPS